MLASLNDPYSRFVSPKQFAALAKYDVTGIGLNIGEDVEDGRVKLKVVGIVLGSPAQLAAAKRDVVTAIQRLEAAGATSFVLDLQDNPGGLVQSGVEIAKLFLERGQTVVYTEARPGDLPQKRSIEATGKPLTRAPLTVLVNGRTASASEIVAGALHDNCRAVLVGSRTFGKGLIQSVYELNDGSGMVVTVGKYVTPGLVDIDGNGIAADFRRKPSGEMARWKLANCKVPSS
ncbi:unnamed protein product [Closterium sp. Yama58-4]|nr:unnamed protein product [Closterium sp. Yama58-4]